MKIKKNFLVVSNFNNDISWVPNYTNNYLIYNRSNTDILPKKIDPNKVIRSPNIGYNLYDYFTYIIDHYHNLPNCIIFAKGNVFPRHVTVRYFEKIANNSFFTPIEDFSMHKTYWPQCFFSSDGGFCERNDNWYISEHQAKYFYTYDDFLKFCFLNPVIPRYIRFAPGASYIVPRQNITKLPKMFYKNLKFFISHCSLPSEAHIIERALHTLWTANFDLNPKMLRPTRMTDFTNKISDKNRLLLKIKNIESNTRRKLIIEPLSLLIEKLSNFN